MTGGQYVTIQLTAFDREEDGSHKDTGDTVEIILPTDLAEAMNTLRSNDDFLSFLQALLRGQFGESAVLSLDRVVE